MDLNPTGVIWKWRDDTGWKDYDQETCGVLEASYSAGFRKVTLSNGWFARKGYSVHFSKMVQHNESTDAVRLVQRVDPSLKPKWHWKNDDKWEAYAPETCQEIEVAFQSNRRTVPLTTGFFKQKNYTVILKNSQVCQLNNQTGVTRDIRRIHGNPPALKNQSSAPTKPLQVDTPVFGNHHQYYQEINHGWFWKENSSWKKYEEAVQNEIQAAFINNDDHLLITKGNFGKTPGTYLVDFKAMAHVNLSSGSITTIKRVGLEHTSPRVLTTPKNTSDYVLPPGIVWTFFQVPPKLNAVTEIPSPTPPKLNAVTEIPSPTPPKSNPVMHIPSPTLPKLQHQSPPTEIASSPGRTWGVRPSGVQRQQSAGLLRKKERIEAPNTEKPEFDVSLLEDFDGQDDVY